MKGDVAGKPPQSPATHHGHTSGPSRSLGRGPDRRRDPPQLPGRQPARRGAGAGREGLRDSAQLRARLEEVRNNREDVQLHTLGAIWHRSRLTCPSRQQLGSYLLDALDPELASYFKFHLEVIECPFCQANLADLDAQSKAAAAPQASKTRQHRILKSSRHLLGEEGGGRSLGRLLSGSHRLRGPPSRGRYIDWDASRGVREPPQ